MVGSELSSWWQMIQASQPLRNGFIETGCDWSPSASVNQGLAPAGLRPVKEVCGFVLGRSEAQLEASRS